MGKSLLLFLAFSLAAVASSGVRAATLYGGDYARIGVPDLEQAVAFFQDVLDCRLIGPESVAAEATPGVRYTVYHYAEGARPAAEMKAKLDLLLKDAHVSEH